MGAIRGDVLNLGFDILYLLKVDELFGSMSLAQVLFS